MKEITNSDGSRSFEIEKDGVLFRLKEKCDWTLIVTRVYVTTKFKGGEIVIPDNAGGNPITEINTYGKIDTNGLEYDLIIPDSIKQIYSASFTGCSPIRKLFIGKNVQLIGKHSFYKTSVDEVYWPDECCYVAANCFGMATVKRFVASNNLRYLDSLAFAGGNLETLDLTNVIGGEELMSWAGTRKIREIIPPFYGTATAELNGYQLDKDGVLKRMEQLGEAKIKFVDPKGAHFALTGKFGDRNKLAEAIIQKGGRIDSMIGEDTTYIIVGSEPDDNMLYEAEINWVATISEGNLIL